MDATPAELNLLFPTPAPPPRSTVSPIRHSGWSADSTQALLTALKENHQRWHIFFNDQKFHNHASHHLLAIYALGASAETLNAAYETHVVYQRPSFKSPGAIDKSNWKDHLGKDEYYQAYLAFFSSELLAKGTQAVLEEYVFSKDAKRRGFVHPLIHTGYGAEFGMPGMVAEGIAQAAGQEGDAIALFPAELFESPQSVSSMTSRLASFALSAKPSKPTSESPHALTILGKIHNDISMAPDVIGLVAYEGIGNPLEHVERVVDSVGDKIKKYASEWTVSPTKEDLEAKLEEVIWMNTVIYAIGGYAGREQGHDEKKKFNGDFFLMHLVTSGLLVPSLLETLSPNTAVLLLRTYFTVALVLYVARGRPALPILDFYKSTTSMPTAPGMDPSPAPKTLPPATAPNPWLHILQTTLVHPDEHLCKAQRALAHSAELYGGAPAGRFAHASKDLEGAELLDGTLFVRAASLTADRLGWMREGEEQRSWDHIGFFRPT
ncbi:hypothetical protein EW026_g4588 [Hermanssonia centrifuga]|uniref:Oxidoreductase AflY n=1 Tax=Hermanssonia centrifuga TaxID=98765 RepID=A0A4V3XAA2_9APHY|nr:hypothetical protein EW026_g4588 [Hermanssonia centrifuga]